MGMDYFNPRSRKGNDRKAALQRPPERYISIHVPARGTTVFRLAERIGFAYFNPRSRKGNDFFGLLVAVWYLLFQSTFPQGERLDLFKQLLPVIIFQSTFPQGERPYSGDKRYWYFAFQSTFPQGERRIAADVPVPGVEFQSTFPQGERQICAARVPALVIISIHVPARGTT